MSNHHFESTYQGERVLVDLGWDRPMQHHFLVVSKIEVKESDRASPVAAHELDDDEDFGDDGIVYSNLNEMEAFNLSLGYFKAKLQELEIAVPDSMFEQAEIDSFNNVGNRVVTHSSDGTFKENLAGR